MSLRDPWKVRPGQEGYVVQFSGLRWLRFGPWTCAEHAANFARRLNKRWLGEAGGEA